MSSNWKIMSATNPLKAFSESLPAVASLLDFSHNGVVVIDAQGVILLYNRAAMRIFGDDVSPVGLRFAEIRPETWPDIKRVLDTGRAQIGKRIDLPQATIIANRNPVVAEGRVVGVLSVFQDISAYEDQISQLQGYKRLLRQMEVIFENSQDGLYLADGNAVTLKVNQAYERITGLKREDLIGRSMQELVNEKILDHSVTLEVLKRKKPVNIMQHITGGKQVMVTGTPIMDENGEIAMVISNVRDMTALNELRSELERTKRLTERFHQALLEKEQFEYALKDMVVKSKAMTQVVRKALKVANAGNQVLLYGESGVGKSMLAHIIHNMGPRKDKPFVKINCGTIPDSLMESELFGYAKGAFTGAAPAGKAGLVEAGHGGTVFFDEIGDLTLAMQVKLLQVIEEKTFTRVGGTAEVSVDVNIIVATNRDLKDMVRRGLFRDDLYYRLNVLPIHIPPLRERREDIPALAMRILEKFNRNKGVEKRMQAEVLDRLMFCYDYPGNVRELINIIERMIVMSDSDLITTADLPEFFKEPQHQSPALEGMSLKGAVAETESRMIRMAVDRHDSLAEAAASLGIHPTTLWRKMKRLGLGNIAKTQ